MPVIRALAHWTTGVMNSDFSDISAELESWYQRDRGQYLLETVRAQLESILDTSFGYHLLQIGPMRAQSLFETSRINHRIYCSDNAGGDVGLVASAEELPLESDSVDTLIAMHCLDFSAHPHQALREMQRVVTPQGKLIIIGFNPYSLLGATARLRGLAGNKLWRNQEALSSHRLSDWLHLLGCQIESQHTLYNVPPIGGGRLKRWLTSADQWSSRHAVPFGGVYVLHAIKQVAGTHRPDGHRFRRQRLIGLAVPKPTAVPAPTPARPAARHRDKSI
ncbi:MAG: methyltransferase domain-containing protein [Halieaceae bacterium]